MDLLTRDQIVRALEALNQRLAARDQRAEIFLVGGAVMCLVHDARPATKDVDAWFVNPSALRTAAAEVAEDLGLPSNWLNDAAKAFVPANAEYETWRELDHLRISTIDARALLAMKCAASRTEEDVEDIRFLARLLGLGTSAEILALVLCYYPSERLPVRVRLLLEEMFDDG